jgi:Xaa-Pro aminopeptidase
MITTNNNDTSVPRLGEVRRALKRKELDGFLVTDMNNVRYLSGFSGSSAFLLIERSEKFFATDFRYKEQSEREVKGWEIIIETGNRMKIIQRLCNKLGIKKLGFESSSSYAFFERLSGIGVSPIACAGLVEKVRLIKESAEIDSIRKAVGRAEAAFLDVRPYVRAGSREISLALRLEERLRKRGCGRIPFDTIVASGPNSAMPHAKPTERKLDRGDLVIVDWGGEAEGYYSDMTRTILIKGDAGLDKKKEIYQIVLRANQKAISRVAAGVHSKEIDAAARDLIRKAGYGEYFGHGTGHGVGLQVHEAPRISRFKSERISGNTIFTIEPGIYLPGVGGVRIEDMVLARENAAEILTSLKKDLEIV